MRLIPFLIAPAALVILGCNPPRQYHSSLRSTWPQTGIIPSCAVGTGVVYLKNNSNITGQILICPYGDGDHEVDSSAAYLSFLPTTKVKKQDIQHIYYEDIAKVRIQEPGSNDSSEFRTFGGTIANLLGTKNRVKLYHRLWKSSSSVDINNNLIVSSGEMVLTDDDKIVAQFSTLASSTGWWATVPNFINKRYHEHLDKHYFEGKDKFVLVNYLLDKENDLLNITASK